MDLSNILGVPAKNQAAEVTDPIQQVYSDYMANIIKQMPSPGKFKVLTGTANSQVSFYFKSPITNELNATFYNNQLSQRVQGLGEQYGVGQVKVLSSPFTNAYNQLYLSLRYHLSQQDEATKQELEAEVASSIKELRPIWNAWVGAFPDSGVPKLDDTNTYTALIQMTATVQTKWINPEYVKNLEENPSYPYEHMAEFNIIFNEIPLSVPRLMRDKIKDVYSAQGAAGGLTARVANATQTIDGIRGNIKTPTAQNGGLPITGTTRMVPGLEFTPADPLILVNELKTQPPTGVLKYDATITKTEDTTLNFEASGGTSISIPILRFFSLGVSGGARTSIFKEDFAGSKFTVGVVFNNPTLQPDFTVTPTLYNISTGVGWMEPTPVLQALENEGKTDVTGYVFDSPPTFDFGEGGDLGYISTYVLSQFMELNLKFEQCKSKEVKKYFEQHASASIRFLGIPLGGVSESSSYSYNYSHETDTSITVTLKPNPPGYTPGGGGGITESLSNLVSVGVVYPFAEARS